MKKLIVLGLMALFLAGCSQSMTRSDILQHDTMYKSWDHLKFSWFGHNNPTSEDLNNSAEQQWWGIEVPYVPEQ